MLKVLFTLLTIFAFTPSVFSQNKDTDILVGQRDTPAEFPDGQAAMFKFIQSKLRLPKKAANCVSGTVYVNFCIEEDGSISEIKIMRGLCQACNDEVKRVISSMPKWKPAVELGTKKPIRTYFTVPTRVNLE
jgi:periplasmic protein TonB